jgi:ribosome maturation factor RimP
MYLCTAFLNEVTGEGKRKLYINIIEGASVPSFVVNMLDRNRLENIVNDYLKGSDKFLVGITVRKSNVVDVFVDGDSGMPIKECATLSRHIEKQFDREVEDYELRVSSPGIDKPFVMKRQYKKYVNREIIVKLTDEKPFKGVLVGLHDDGITINRLSGKKGQEGKTISAKFSDIEEAKPVIGFK